MSTVFGDFGLNDKNILTDINAVDDSLFARILADDILVEIRKCALVRSGRKSYDECVKVFEHLAPDIVY